MTGSIALVGFMGAGKTRVGRLVARRLDVPFVDTDKVLSGRHGTIAALFEERGEEGFREIERDVVLEQLAAAENGPRVVALGGGAVTIDDVRKALRRLPHVVWLDAPPEVLFGRLRPGTRPLARDEARFAELYDERRPLYAEVATAAVRSTGHERLAQVVERVLGAVAAWTGASAPFATLTVAVRAGGDAYEVLVGAGLLARLGELVGGSATQAVVVCDENVAPLYLERVRSSLEAAGRRSSSVVVPPGEQAKTQATLSLLYDRLYDLGVGRGDVVVALGGGVVGDMAGYAAATFLRGVGLVQVPTTLLAMVDAAVGGKVAVDYREGKNYLGTV